MAASLMAGLCAAVLASPAAATAKHKVLFNRYGRRILFTSDRDGDFDLYTVNNPGGAGLKKLTQTAGNDAHGSWCGNGDWIVFTSGRKGFKDEMALYDGVPQPCGEIFAMRADGSDVRQLTDNKWEDSSAVCAPEPRQLWRG
jgi:Tol biopolymer transport system component